MLIIYIYTEREISFLNISNWAFISLDPLDIVNNALVAVSVSPMQSLGQLHRRETDSYQASLTMSPLSSLGYNVWSSNIICDTKQKNLFETTREKI